MIIQETETGYRLIRQEDHAHLAGELAARWTQPPGMRSAFIAAARLHDNGWREADRAPTTDSAKRPHSYRTLPDEPYLEVWERGIQRAAAIDPLVGLLVGLHGARFLRTDHSEAHTAFQQAERARQNAVLATLQLRGTWDVLPREVARASDLVAFLDGLSLFACGEWASPWCANFEGTEFVCMRETRTITVSPWPFNGPFTFPLRMYTSSWNANENELRRTMGGTHFVNPLTVRPRTA